MAWSPSLPARGSGARRRPRSGAAAAIACLALAAPVAGCALANASGPPQRRPSDYAQPPERTSMDETDGATAPRGSAARPPYEGAGYPRRGEDD
jgi:hypothetical protein